MTLPKQRRGDDVVEQVWQVVQRAQQGDQQAITDLYNRYRKTVLSFIYGRTKNPVLTEDLASDVWVKALKGIGGYSHTGRDFGAWLLTIARNRTADYFKSGQVRTEILTADFGSAKHDPVDDHREGQPEFVLDEMTYELVRKAVQCLSPDQREVLINRYLDERSAAETAARMGKNEGAVKAAQWRATNSLARLIAPLMPERGVSPRTVAS